MLNPDLFLDDLVIGDSWPGGPITIAEADIIRFAREFDPQPMHTDPQAAAQGRFGGLIASGWHVASLVMRDFVDTAPFGATPMLGLRVDELQWLHPVRPGDTLHIRREIVAVARSRSKPDRGTISMKMTVSNQDGAIVLSFLNLIQMPARSGGGIAP
ncbi:MAG: MaoC family dehydratase [Pseudomonadota bacterium]|uniref:MaoC family dehydratase n=1 Tax=Sphingomonas sp. ERG5 TaxID=1381597 RepID=UPI00054B0194|nr:MaoC family dehydratase [Sphingomonas sp. ERG5]